MNDELIVGAEAVLEAEEGLVQGVEVELVDDVLFGVELDVLAHLLEPVEDGVTVFAPFFGVIGRSRASSFRCGATILRLVC